MRAYSNLCADIGYLSLNHAGEQLCGDHIEIAEENGRSIVIVLADGLGSGVKANILSTLTSKIISTMLAAGLNLTNCVETIAATLPVCSERGLAYSTFTILRLIDNERAEIIQYDNPPVILLRDGKHVELPSVTTSVGGKQIVRSDVTLRENDVFIAMSDGVEHAGAGGVYNFGWRRADIARYMETLWHVGFSAKTLSAILLRETCRLYEGVPADDATVCTVRIRARAPLNLLCGPPANREDGEKMMSLFFGKEGKHVVCGGTTSEIAADYLKKPLVADLDIPDPDIPPTARISGVDLVTEGVVTLGRVLKYANNYLGDNGDWERWSEGKDGASRVARLLFEEATDINLFVGRAVNPAYQDSALPACLGNKMELIRELTDCLERMGKRVKTSYF